MGRPVFIMDTETTEYTKVPDMGALCFDCNLEPEEAAMIRKPMAIISTKTGQAQFKVLEITRKVGPPTNGRHPYRLKLERFV